MIKNRLWICFISIVTFFIAPSIFSGYQAFAYRPFVSTDADVAEKGEVEIEFGVLGILHDREIDEITAPSLILNYGLSKKWELVSEFDAQVYRKGEDRNFELKEPAIFLKGIVREGILQDQEGQSVAVEFGFLFPSTVVGERKAGVEGIGILSGKKSSLVYHFNLGGELDRENFDPNGIWGIILEYPFKDRFRLVGEVNGVFKQHEIPENSGLIGFIGDVRGIDFDIGLRKGFTDTFSYSEFTTGITFSF